MKGKRKQRRKKIMYMEQSRIGQSHSQHYIYCAFFCSDNCVGLQTLHYDIPCYHVINSGSSFSESV